MSEEEFQKLGPGDIVVGRGASDAIIVTANYGGRVTAVRTYDLTNPSKWSLLRKVKADTQGQPAICLGHVDAIAGG